MKKSMLVLLVIAVMLCGAAQGEEMASYPVSFLENQTTGYAWLYTVSDDMVLAVADNGYQPAENSEMAVGGGGTHSWDIGGLRKGEASVTFTYSQAWDPQPADPEVTFTFAVDDTGDLTLVAAAGLPEQYMPDKAVVRLNENPTTGYLWEAQAEPNGILSPIGDTYEAQQQASLGAAGAGGVHTWIYSGTLEGTVVLTFRYTRSFEPDEPPASIMRFTYIVDENLYVTLMGMDGDYETYIPAAQE